MGDLQVMMDGGFQFPGAPMHAGPQLFFGKQGEPAFHLLQPGGAGGREMQMEAGPLGQPSADPRGLVGGVVVHDEMDVQVLRHGCFNGVEEIAELHGAMAALALTNHLAALDVQAANREVVPQRM